MSDATPLVRTSDGAILGVDYRRTDLAREEYRVPGRIPVRLVMPGDTLVAQGVRVVVQTVGESRGNVVVSCLTRGGAPVVIVRPAEQLIRVVEAGAFDR